MKLESIHDDMLTRSELTPASSVRRGLSTTARMRRPMAVYLSMSVSTRNTRAPQIAIARSSRLTNTLWSGLNVWLPWGTMPTALALVFEPNHRNTMLGMATNRPSTETSFAVSLAVRRYRNSNRSNNQPTPGPTMPTANSNARYIGQ